MLGAIEENRMLKDRVIEFLKRGLARKQGTPAPARSRLPPLAEARPGEELAPERVADMLLEEEASHMAPDLRALRGIGGIRADYAYKSLRSGKARA
jgi:hypothetical protein